uniref:Uncharacterized protein n=1 Tax=Anolis carolinensis TaxID=28377 RepID=A0A803TMG8_ANOCA
GNVLFGGEPLSYTRFSLARQPDGDNSHVEMKLSAEDEEVGENGSIDHLHTQTVRPKNSNRHIWFVLSAVTLLFLIGETQKLELFKSGLGQLGPSGCFGLQLPQFLTAAKMARIAGS